MLRADADRVLRDQLEAAGADPASPTEGSARRAWEAFRKFAAIPTEDRYQGSHPHDDGILVQYGTYDWGEGEHFELDFTRQFSYNDEAGDYSHMEQLRCTLLFSPTPWLRSLGAGEMWSFDLDLEDFFERAARMEGVAKVLDANTAPDRIELRREEV